MCKFDAIRNKQLKLPTKKGDSEHLFRKPDFGAKTIKIDDFLDFDGFSPDFMISEQMFEIKEFTGQF